MQQTQRQTNTDMLLERELGEGEQLRWSGRPRETKGRRSQSVNTFLILAIVFGSIGILFLLLATIFLFGVPDPAKFVICLVFYIIGGVFTYLALFFGLFSLFYRFSTKNLHYAITDQRVLIIRSGRVLTVESYYKDDITQIKRIEREDGSGDLIFDGSRGFSNMYSYNSRYRRYGTSYGYATGQGSASGGGRFVNISEVHETERILRATFKQNDSIC